MQGTHLVHAGTISEGQDYLIDFCCTTPGPEIDKGSVRGRWTGEIDTWGKLTIESLNGRKTLYLFASEFVNLQRL